MEKCFWGTGRSWKSPGNFFDQKSGNPVNPLNSSNLEQLALICACSKCAQLCVHLLMFTGRCDKERLCSDHTEHSVQ